VTRRISTCCTAALMMIMLLLSGCAANRGAGAPQELATSSDQSDSQRRSRIRLQLAVGYYEQGQYQVALDEVKQALLVDPEFADAYSMRALIYMSLGETRLAEENFSHALRLAPNNPDIANNYGWFLCQNRREKQSISYFEAALTNPTYQSPAKALNNAGVCALRMGDSTVAEEYFVRAFRENPASPATNFNLAKIYYGHQDYERARFYVNRVIAADVLAADVLWLAIKVERKLGDRVAEAKLVAQLSRRYPNSAEYAYYQRGAFDE
jgi:type IV pilus assembly protein PilF